MTNHHAEEQGGRIVHRDRGLAVGLWAVLALVLAGLGLRALDACAIAWPGASGSLSYCPPPAPADLRDGVLDRAEAREAMLEERLERLRLQLVSVPDCPPPPPEPVEVAEAPPEEPAEPPPEPDIPEQEWEEQDLGLLEGCWERVTNMVVIDHETGEETPVAEWRICFDEQGNGTQELTYENGVTCSGTVTAEFRPDGRMRLIDDGDLPCSDGTRIFRGINDCRRLPDGTARCVGRQPEVGVDNIRSLFRR